MPDWLLFVLGAASSALVVLLASNFSTAERRLARLPPRFAGSAPTDFRRATDVLLGPAILPGNSVEPLVNGVEIFPAMLEAIHGAQRSLCFETFIYWSGDIGEEFAKGFCGAAKRGVAVHVLLDWVGSRTMDPKILAQMKDSGVEVRQYHPLSWYHLSRLNNRTHRKLLIADGTLGFTGGVGIAPQWTGNAEDPEHWRDTHFRVRGPVVAQMQSVFLDNWMKATGEVLHGENYFPRLEHAGSMEAQMFGSSPSGGAESMHLLMMLAIGAAQRSIEIANAYFVPDRLTLHALREARRRGVRIRILVPGPHIDEPLVRLASHADYETLLDAGIEIYEYMPTMKHCKVMIVDERWVSVGSANFDTRSFRLNDEANLNVFSDELAHRLTEVFEADLKPARKLARRRWYRRGYGRRVLEWFATQLRSQL